MLQVAAEKSSSCRLFAACADASCAAVASAVGVVAVAAALAVQLRAFSVEGPHCKADATLESTPPIHPAS